MIKGEPPSKKACSVSRVVVNFADEGLPVTKEVGVQGKLMLQSENAGVVIGDTPVQEKEKLQQLANGFPVDIRVACRARNRHPPFLYYVELNDQISRAAPNTEKLLAFLGLRVTSLAIEGRQAQIDAVANIFLSDHKDGPPERDPGFTRWAKIRSMSASLLLSADYSAFDASQCDAVSNVVFQELFKAMFHADAATRHTLLEELMSNARITVEAYSSEDGTKRGCFDPKILNPDGRTNGNLSGNGRTTFRNNAMNTLVSYKAILLFLMDVRDALMACVRDSDAPIVCPALALYGHYKECIEVPAADVERSLILLCPILFPHMFLVSGDDSVTCCPMQYLNAAADEIYMKVGLECAIFRDARDPYHYEVNFLAKKYHFEYDPDLHYVTLICSYPIVLRAIRKMLTSAPHRWPGRHIGFAFISAALGRFVQTTQTGSCGPVPYLHELIMAMAVIGLSLLTMSRPLHQSSPDQVRSFVAREAEKGSQALTVFADRNLTTNEKISFYDRLLETVSVWSGTTTDTHNRAPLTGTCFCYTDHDDPDAIISDLGRPISFGSGSTSDHLVFHDLWTSGFDPDLLLAFTTTVRGLAFQHGIHNIPADTIAELLRCAPQCSEEMEQLKVHAAENGFSMFYTQPISSDGESKRITLEVVRPPSSSASTRFSDTSSTVSSSDLPSADSICPITIKENGQPISKKEYIKEQRAAGCTVSTRILKNRYDYARDRVRTPADLERAGRSPEVTNLSLDVARAGRRTPRPDTPRTPKPRAGRK